MVHIVSRLEVDPPGGAVLAVDPRRRSWCARRLPNGRAGYDGTIRFVARPGCARMAGRRRGVRGGARRRSGGARGAPRSRGVAARSARMTCASPAALGVAAAAALATVALHFIATRRPVPAPLPTARFIDDSTMRGASRATRLSDRWLLLLGCWRCCGLGAGFAGPRPEAAAHAHRIWLVDRSRAERHGTRCGARPSRRPATWWSCSIRWPAWSPPIHYDGCSDPQRADRCRRRSLPRCCARWRAAVRAESVTVLVVSPSAIEETDSATARFKATVRGRVRWMRDSDACAECGASYRARGDLA